MQGAASLDSGREPIPADGRYRVLAELGQGGMAHVYLAVARGPSGFNKLVVLKALRRNLAADPDCLAMFLNEARIAARLNHPNVVQTYEVGEDGGAHIIVMEYLEGQPLSQVVIRSRKKETPISTAMHLRVLIDTLAGLQYAHELEDYDGRKLSLVHRDVSPQNIFVTFDGHVKVLDFGIAKAVGSQGETQTGIIKGKVRYMAPEQMAGETVDRRADLFSVGVMLWEVAAGQPLWKGESDVSIMNKAMNGLIPSPRSVNPAVSESLERIVMKALAFQATDRFQTARELENALERELDAIGDTVRPRDLGEFVLSLFVDTRAETKSIIEQQLSKVATLSVGEYEGLHPIRLPGSLTISTGSGSGSMRDASAPHGITVQEPAPHGGRSRMALLLAALVLVIATVVVTVWFTQRNAKNARENDLANRPTATQTPIAAPSPAQSSTAAPVPSPATIELHLTATPAEATLHLDDEKLASNPYTGKVTVDGSVHHIRAEARGYTSKTIDVSFAKDVTTTIALERAPKGAKPATTVTKPPPAKPNCATPYYFDDRGIKKFKPECM
jgi:eukaryotic-like serine/threonine-protein kinase